MEPSFKPIRDALAASGEPTEAWRVDVASNGHVRIETQYPSDPDARGQVGRFYNKEDAALIVLLRNNATALIEYIDQLVRVQTHIAGELEWHQNRALQAEAEANFWANR